MNLEPAHVIARCPACRNELARDGSCGHCTAAVSVARLRAALQKFRPVAMQRVARKPFARRVVTGELASGGQDAALPPSDRE